MIVGSVMLIRGGSDSVYVWINNQKITIPKKQMDYDCAGILLQLYRDHVPESIYYVNGPGSFTNVRVMGLLLSLLKKIHPEVTLYECDKTEFWSTCHRLGDIGSSMALFIGQRKNVWLMDYEKQTHKLVTKASLVESENMLWDIMSDYVDGHSIDISFIDGQVVLLLDDKEKKIISKDKFPWREVEKIQPHYGMEPNIG